MRTRKYNYLKVIQQYYSGSYGWEDVSEYDTNSGFNFNSEQEREVFLSDLKEYRLLGYPTRSVKRREINLEHAN